MRYLAIGHCMTWASVIPHSSFAIYLSHSALLSCLDGSSCVHNTTSFTWYQIGWGHGGIESEMLAFET